MYIDTPTLFATMLILVLTVSTLVIALRENYRLAQMNERMFAINKSMRKQMNQMVERPF